MLGSEAAFSTLMKPSTDLPVVAVDQLNPHAYEGQRFVSPHSFSPYDGDKFLGGFGTTQIQFPDYWTLRQRSAQLFNENHYARGILRRLVTNAINTGLTPEAIPDEDVLGIDEDTLNAWSDLVEIRFGIWGKNPFVCDWKQVNTFGALQAEAYLEALISGDCLVSIRRSRATKLPVIRLIGGNRIRTPFASDSSIPKGHIIEHGVQMDRKRRVVAYWILTDDGKFERLPAFGERSGRRLAWLVFGTDKRLDDVRGQPILSIILQSLKELDRYRDSAQRKALINSILAMFIKKTEDKIGSLPITGGAQRRDAGIIQGSDGVERKFDIAQQIPGVVFEELQQGEEPVGFDSQGTDINFPGFEKAIIQSIGWAMGIPPEILTLSFSNNYSASQAAINEFKIFLHQMRVSWGEVFCTPIYNEWLISETLNGDINAPGLLEAWRTLSQWDVFGAWTQVEWYGSIKPSTDMKKQAQGSEILVSNGWTTNDKESRELTGTKFSRNVKRLKRENKQIAEAKRPLLELLAEFGEKAVSKAIVDDDEGILSNAEGDF